MDIHTARMQTACLMALVFHFFNEDWGRPWGGAGAVMLCATWVLLQAWGDHVNARGKRALSKQPST